MMNILRIAGANHVQVLVFGTSMVRAAALLEQGDRPVSSLNQGMSNWRCEGVTTYWLWRQLCPCFFIPGASKVMAAKRCRH